MITASVRVIILATHRLPLLYECPASTTKSQLRYWEKRDTSSYQFPFHIPTGFRVLNLFVSVSPGKRNIDDGGEREESVCITVRQRLQDIKDTRKVHIIILFLQRYESTQKCLENKLV